MAPVGRAGGVEVRRRAFFGCTKLWEGIEGGRQPGHGRRGLFKIYRNKQLNINRSKMTAIFVQISH